MLAHDPDERTGSASARASQAQAASSVVLRPMRFDGDRREAVAVELPSASPDGLDDRLQAVEAEIASAAARGAALAYGVVAREIADAVFGRLGFTSLGPLPELARPLRLSAVTERLALGETARGYLATVPLLAPFGRRRRSGVREILVDDPRVTRLWDRFSIDVGAAVERNARWVGPRIFGRPEHGYRAFVFEDGDRYVIRALCIFRMTTDRARGLVVELLHDRSVTGMRAASHLLGLALRELSDAGAESATAWSLPHSGSFPILVRHGFVPRRAANVEHVVGVRALDPSIAHVVEERGLWYLSGLDLEAT